MFVGFLLFYDFIYELLAARLLVFMVKSGTDFVGSWSLSSHLFTGVISNQMLRGNKDNLGLITHISSSNIFCAYH